jgi:hypothetical protein
MQQTARMAGSLRRRTVAGMLFRRSFRKGDLLRRCPDCRSRLVCPMDWEPHDESHWHIDLRCGECGHWWDAVVEDSRASRYDIELDADRSAISRALHRLELERMAIDVETFTVALARDLIEPADFTA